MNDLDRNQGQNESPAVNNILRSSDDAKNYFNWKHSVDKSFRNLIEGSMMGKKTKVGKSEHPLIQDFLNGTSSLLDNPQALPHILDIDESVKKQLGKLQSVAMPDGSSINVFELMKNPNIDFQQKHKWYSVQIEPRLKWLIERAAKITNEVELQPPDSNDTLDPSMDEMSEGKEAPSEGFYEVAPYYGGYYKGAVYENWDQDSLKWTKDEKLGRTIVTPIELEDSTVRTIAGKFKIGEFQPVDLPYNFVIDPSSLPLNCNVSRGDDGVWYIHSSQENLEFKIGKPKQTPSFTSKPPTPKNKKHAPLPQEVKQKITDAKTSTLDEISKARILCSFVKKHLEYSNDSQYNAIYKQNPASYFELMWQHKKADCDVANTFAAEVLRQADINVRMVAGHYIKGKTKKGTALLHSGTGHAWLEVYDPSSQKWIRLDATPKGDPNMDEEEQEEQEENEDNDGDFGENEAEILSEEELKELIEKLEEEERKIEESRQTPEMLFAKEADCTVEEASIIMRKISKLRSLTDDNGNNLLGQSQKTWDQALKKNLRERTVYEGPVTMNEGIELVDTVSAWIDVKSKNENPTGFEKPEKRIEIERSFGGFEVYIAADMSGSMNEIDSATGQSKASSQRDSVFLFVDSVMSNAQRSKIASKKLKNPMPVKVCVSVFGAKTEIVLPVTDQWGPKEQLALYRALDKGAGGSTPDDKALRIIQEQISTSKSKDTKMHRFVAVFADGGSDNASSVRAITKEMRDDGTVVFGFGVTESGRAMEAVYAPDAKTIPNTSKLAQTGIQELVKTVKKWYNV